MKLRNKKTGEIVRVEFLSNWQTDDGTEIGFRECNTNIVYTYTSLAELNEEWEDVPKEPKYFYCICTEGSINKYEVERYATETWVEQAKSIGNYFETYKEAEKAVEKFKAWKRLKDKGFKFEKWGMGGEYGNTITFSDYIVCNDETIEDLDTCFGGEG